MKWQLLFLIGVSILKCKGREPYRPKHGVLPFIIYFHSRYRGLCLGSLISRSSVITAAICVTSPDTSIRDQRSINVVTGTTYRHPARGIRVQIKKILIPNFSRLSLPQRGYMMARSPAVLIMKRRVPDVLAEVPLRPIDIDMAGANFPLQEECLMAGFHFFYKGDKIFPVMKFLLQRNLRAQSVNIVKKSRWCDDLYMKFRLAINNLGFSEYASQGKESICVRDPLKTAQACHGMYGAPLICRAKVVGIMLAPDAQWTNCSGFSNIIHRLDNNLLRGFMECIYRLVEIENPLDWDTMRKGEKADSEESLEAVYDSDIYENILSSSDEWSNDTLLQE